MQNKSIIKYGNSFFQLVLWLAIVGFSLYFFLDNVFPYVTGYRSKGFGDSLFNNQVFVVLHLVGGTLTLFLGPLQFFKKLRTKYLSWHRLIGKIYMLGAMLVGFSALRMSFISTCVSCRISLLITGILLLMTIAFAWISIKNKQVKTHQQFVIRSYVLILAFVFVRLDGIISMKIIFGAIEDSTFNRTVNEYFFSFVPLIIAEIFLTWLPAMRRARH